MHQSICFFEIDSLPARYRLQMASVIIAEDGDTETTLFSDPKIGGFVLTVEMGPGDILFESSDFRRLCELVEKLRGSCKFKIADPIHTAPIFSKGSEPTNRIKDSQPLDAYYDNDDDDDEPANWWKRGQN